VLFRILRALSAAISGKGVFPAVNRHVAATAQWLRRVDLLLNARDRRALRCEKGHATMRRLFVLLAMKVDWLPAARRTHRSPPNLGDEVSR
jgi:hypothetical protein